MKKTDTPSYRNFRYKYSAMTMEDLEGFYNLVEFETDKNGFIPYDALSVDTYQTWTLLEDIAALTEYGYSVQEAWDYVLPRIEFVEEDDE